MWEFEQNIALAHGPSTVVTDQRVGMGCTQGCCRYTPVGKHREFRLHCHPPRESHGNSLASTSPKWGCFIGGLDKNHAMPQSHQFREKKITMDHDYPDPRTTLPSFGAAGKTFPRSNSSRDKPMEPTCCKTEEAEWLLLVLRRRLR